jgi:hypothetical protein
MKSSTTLIDIWTIPNLRCPASYFIRPTLIYSLIFFVQSFWFRHIFSYFFFNI